VKVPGTIYIPDLKGVFYGVPETVIVHRQEAFSGNPGRSHTTVELTGTVHKSEKIARLMNEQDHLEGWIDDKPFTFWSLDLAMQVGMNYHHTLSPMATLRMYASPREPVLHPVVVWRRRHRSE
jgi:hypothetical protein